MILYLHGFRSSPQSFKAQLLSQAFADKGVADQWFCPQLPASPAATLKLCNQLIEKNLLDRGLQPAQELVVIGSSLGGYYAACLAEQWQCRAIVLNPVVNAARDLATQVGKHSRFHSDEPFEFLPEHVDELAAMAPQRPRNPNRYFLLAATGDELLDWREMADWYANSHGFIIQGSDHGLSDFETWLPDVVQFALQPQLPAFFRSL